MIGLYLKFCQARLIRSMLKCFVWGLRDSGAQKVYLCQISADTNNLSLDNLPGVSD